MSLAPFSVRAEEGGELFLVDARSDHAEPPGHGGGTPADIGFARHVVEVEPLAVGAFHDPCRAQNGPVGRLVHQRVEDPAQSGFVKFLRRFDPPAGKDLVGVVVMMVMVMVFVLVLVVIVVVMVVAGTVRIVTFVVIVVIVT